MHLEFIGKMSLIRYTMQKCLFKIVIIMHLTTIQIAMYQTMLAIFETGNVPKKSTFHYIGLHTK